MTANKQMRTEGDLIGDRQLPADALYGVQTLRGMENFQISNFKLSQYPYFIKGLATPSGVLLSPTTARAS